MKPLILACLFLNLLVIQAQKRAVTINDFNTWNSFSNTILHPEGAFLCYEIKPGKGDKTLVINWFNKEKTDTFFRGEGLQYNKDATLLAFKLVPTLQQERQAKKNNSPKNKEPKDTLCIISEKTDTILKFPNVKFYGIPKEGNNWIAFTSEEKFEAPADTSSSDSIKTKRKKSATKGGDNMVILNGSTLDTFIVRHVSSFKWSENGKNLLFTTEKKDSVTQSGIHFFNTNEQSITNIFTIEGEIKKPTINKKGDQFAWLCSNDTLKEKTFELRIANSKKTGYHSIIDTSSVSMPKGWAPSINGNIYFSDSGERLYFGSAPCPTQAPEDTLLSGEKVSVDVWSWHDTYLQPYQKLNLNKDKNKTYPAIFFTQSGKTVQLTTDADLNVRINAKDDNKFSIATTSENYARESNWTAKFLQDYYLVNNITGEIKLLTSATKGGYYSPGENYFTYYNYKDSSYYIIDLKKHSTRKLSEGIPTMLVDEENDRPDDPSNYGIAGWSQNDEHVFIYDKYDLWMLDPKGKRSPKNLTNGRLSETQYRLIRLDREDPFININSPLLLSIFENKTKNSGWASVDANSNSLPEIIIKKAKYFSYPVKAKNADVIYYSQQDCNEYPDLWITDSKFTKPEKITKLNPQKEQLIWSSVQMVSWTSFNGDSLAGLLYTPENLNPDSIYPMLVYFYERNSDNLHRFNSIYPSYSTINKTLYPSNGYVVFIPDIKYRIGYPGQSAYECIVSGVQSLTNQYKWINPGRIGLQGQSWGGYQTAYLITQTNMFAAAMAGAPVSNMTSAYGGIRWGSGMSRMFQYEHTQSRIGGTLWDKTLLYIENSPIFYANKVKTPLLIMHNDDDGAVPWYQGIEYFVALRRLNKPVWLLTYNNEPHNLKPSSWGNRTDLSIRMKQFFDHYLKDEQAPDWMTKGVKATEKEILKGY